MNKLIGTFFFVCVSVIVFAQTYTSRLMQVEFESVTPVETIRAQNKNGVLIMNTEKGEVEAAVLIKGFVFRKALMQQHFNENYMESDKYPKARFSGRFDPAAFSTAKPFQEIWVEGQITIHGVTQPHRCLVKFELKENKLRASSDFPLKPADFSITIPALVRKNINESLNVELVTDWMKPNQ